jgi:hypothetical protein
LAAGGIDYAVIGAIALNQHGYHRFTEDIDIVLTPAGLEAFKESLVGRGYCPAFEGADRLFRSTKSNVPIKMITNDAFPGDCKPKAVQFPDPSKEFVTIDGIQTVPLRKLIETKIASGQTGAGRLKDLADVQELIKTLDLPRDLGLEIDLSVQDKYFELFDDAKPRDKSE